MSIEKMSTVWKHSRHKGNALLLLLAIADNADDEGYCWPGIEYLAKKIKMTPQSVIRLTKELETSRELFVVHSRRNGNKYIVRLNMTNDIFAAVLINKFSFDDEIITNILLYNTYITSQLTSDVSSEVTPMLDESSISVNEPSHVADATSQPSQPEAVGEELVTEYFGAKQEKEPAPITPRWTKRVTGEWTQWGITSVEMREQIAAFGERGRTVQRIGYELERRFEMRPLWDDRKSVKGWMAGISTCLTAADNDETLIFQAASKLIEAGLSVANPWSLQKEIMSLAAGKRRDKKKPKVPEYGSDEWYKQQMAQDVQAEAFR